MKAKQGFYRAMFGKVVEVPYGELMAEIASLAAHQLAISRLPARPAPNAIKQGKRDKRLTQKEYFKLIGVTGPVPEPPENWKPNRKLKPQLPKGIESGLAKHFANSLAKLDLKPFQQFAAIIRTVERYWPDLINRRGFRTNARWLAVELSITGETLTQDQFLERLGIDASDRDNTAYFRRELGKIPGLTFNGKRGPKRGPKAASK